MNDITCNEIKKILEVERATSKDAIISFTRDGFGDSFTLMFHSESIPGKRTRQAYYITLTSRFVNFRAYSLYNLENGKYQNETPVRLFDVTDRKVAQIRNLIFDMMKETPEFREYAPFKNGTFYWNKK